jgi:Rrf2 family protein
VNTNPVVIRRLLLDLQEAGLVKTERGPAGGARLARAASRIKVRDIYRAVEEAALFAAHRRKPSKACPVGCRIESVLEELFLRASKALENELGSITLESLVRKIRRG